MNYKIFAISFQFNLSVTQRLLCDKSEFACLPSAEGTDLLQQELEKQVYQVLITKNIAYLPGKEETLLSFHSPTLLTISQHVPYDSSCSVFISASPIFDNEAMQSLLPFPPALPCSGYCHAFGDLLIIHCLEQVKKPTGRREFLGLLPAGL